MKYRVAPLFVITFTIAGLVLLSILEKPSTARPPAVPIPDDHKATFDRDIRPILSQFCIRCHNAESKRGGIRLDQLTAEPDGKQLFLLKDMLRQLSLGVMPPERQRQPSREQRKLVQDWLRRSMELARARGSTKDGSVRRLTVAQYRNTLRDLLGHDDIQTEILPPDAVSKDGFVNQQQSMLLSPSLVEAYFQVAEEALANTLVDPKRQPTIQNFRVELGKAVNDKPCPDKLILGANSKLLDNADFRVNELDPKKPFKFTPKRMRTKYRFIEGYRGNDTVRGWRDYDDIYHSVFACMRGTDGYPKGRAYQLIPRGLLLRPSIPSEEIFGQSSTYGPRANFKISLRELPASGRFRVTVMAAKYEDGLLLDANTGSVPAPTKQSLRIDEPSKAQTITLEKPGIYQVDVIPVSSKKKPTQLTLEIADRTFTGTPTQSAFLAVRLPKGPLRVLAKTDKNEPIARILLTPLEANDPLAKRFTKFERRSPKVGVHLGFRRDCGSSLSPVGSPQAVTTTELREYVFEGALDNFSRPLVEKDNVNYLAGIREIGVRSEYTDGRDMPRLLLRSVEFEGPFYETWPPAVHRRIFVPSKEKPNSEEHARVVIRTFASRAFRRPITPTEERSLLDVWQEAFEETGNFQKSIEDALLVVLTSPQFLFLIEQSNSPKPEPLDEYELASKLSYFLWNTAPDARLLELARTKSLHESLDRELERMIADPRFSQFADEFASQWLRLDKFDVVEIDSKRFPTLTRDTRTQLRREPVRFLEHCIRTDLPLKTLIRSDFVVANEVTAGYYGLSDHTEDGFDFEAIPHRSAHLGGLLTQSSILSGLSDGREANPVKRGAWLARKILGEPPNDPPPNVPALQEDTQHLPLRERLVRHRSQKGCAECHSTIDPWGLPFEQFDAAGLFDAKIKDAGSTLPDRTKVEDFEGLRSYLEKDALDRVALSFLKHVTTYAIGRSPTFGELETLETMRRDLAKRGYRMKDIVRAVVKSKLFLEK